MKRHARDWSALTKGEKWPVAALLFGADYGLVSGAVQQVRRHLLADDEDAREFDFTLAHGSDLTAVALIDACRALPMFGKRRLVIIKEAEQLGSETAGTLIDYLKRPNPATILLAVAGALEAKHALRKAFEADATAWCVPFYPLAGEELRQWLRSLLVADGFRIEADALNYLGQRLEGGDSALAEQEMSKLRLYLGDERRIGLDHVMAVVGETAEYSGFALMEAVMRGDPAEAMRILDRLLESGDEPIALLGLIVQRLRRLGQAREMVADNLAEKVIATRLQVFWKEEGLFFAASRRLDGRRLADALCWCLETDLALKGGGDIPGEQSLERLVLRLALICGGSRGSRGAA